jgi:formate hydrogenlyase transcriptional activator
MAAGSIITTGEIADVIPGGAIERGPARSFESIVGESPALAAVLEELSLVAPTDATVLVLGETGTGKELIAQAIHNRSGRAGRPFIRVNCAAIPPSLIASELFGHEKGAFTGAVQRRMGRFESAHRGTIFLDEIGELPMETQISLLRVIQERELERIGSNVPVKVDVRIITATNRDLGEAVRAGTFREDLYYRLNVFPIHLPALRERLDDIPLLAEHFMEKIAARAGRRFRAISPATIGQLQAWEWPGNIRELQNVIERAVILCEGEVFSVGESWLERARAGSRRAAPPLAQTLADREREIIEAALAESRGCISGPAGAAVKLGIPRQTLDSKIASLGISKHRFKALPAR